MYLIKTYVHGCVGLAEQDWVGAEQCEIYKEYSKMSGLDLCKKILKGEQECLIKK